MWPGKTWWVGMVLTAILSFTLGCATTGNGPKTGLNSTDGEISDPLEPLNRKIFDFNMGLYDHVLEPVAKGYQRMTPVFLRNRVADFFDNSTYPYIVLNDFLQWRVHQGISDLGRFVANTLFGIGGLFNVADHLGMPAHENNLGVTFGVWKLPQGPYLVLPFFGPSSVSNLPGIPAEILASPFYYVKDSTAQWSIATVGVVNVGYTERDAMRMVKESIAPYYFVRSAWVQHQRYLIRGRDLSSQIMQESAPDLEGSPPSEETPDPRATAR
jgi:phospholipid-binding lipoprotein MlaA